MYIIDAHNHPNYYGHGIKAFLENMALHNISKTWLLTWEAPADEVDPTFSNVFPASAGNGPIQFEHCLDFKTRAPEAFELGYAPDPRRPDAIDRLDAAIKTYGVRICGEIKLRMMYDNPDALRMWRFCGEQNLPVIVHIDYEFATGTKYPRPNYWYGGGIEAFERAVAACPDTTFLGHAPGFWAHISGDGLHDKTPYPEGPVKPGGKITEMLRRYPNLYCDMSAGSGWNALARDEEHARRFITEFQDRVLYARDYFDTRHRELIDGLDLPDAIRNKLYHENAQHLLGE